MDDSQKPFSRSFNQPIIIEEQGPRDGWQVEKKWIPTDMKVAYIHKLVDAGLTRIQVTSFVSPRYVPQMADADQVARAIIKKQGVVYSALVLNSKGVARAVDAGLNHLSVSLSASNAHSVKNTNKTIEASKVEFADMVRQAKNAGVAVRAGIQCAFGCRYEGAIDPNLVLDLVKHHLDLGIDEISLADSTGMANPAAVRLMMAQVVALAGELPVNLHLHDTEGKGLANLLAAYETGVRQFDTAFGGLGGCPFIAGATGNIATEDVVNMLNQMGIETGIDIVPIVEAARHFEAFLERKLPGKIKEVQPSGYPNPQPFPQ